MKAMICTKPDLLEFTQLEMPEKKPGEALIRVRCIGVCGTDYHAYRGKQPFFAYPRILGHEIAAEIAEIENNTQGLQAGDTITLIPYLECTKCIACRRGKPNACKNLKVFGVHVDGGLREFITWPISHIIKTDGLTLSQSAIIEPLSIGAHAVNRANLDKNEVVLVIGAGPIGLAVMKFAKIAGAKVIAQDMNLERLAFCKTWAGADVLVDASQDVIQQLQSATDGDMPTTVIDATGNPNSMMNAFQLVGHGGQIVYVSLVQGDLSFNDAEFHKRELTLMGSRAASRKEFEYVIACMREGLIDTEAYITHRAPFNEAIDAIQTWLNPNSGVIKAVIEL